MCAQPADKVKETPMERMKRLRAAQINKTFQQEQLSVAQKRLAQERDRQARLQIERVALESRRRSRSPNYRLFVQVTPPAPCCTRTLSSPRRRQNPRLRARRSLHMKLCRLHCLLICGIYLVITLGFESQEKSKQKPRQAPQPEPGPVSLSLWGCGGAQSCL